jgi:TIR domain
MSGGIFISYRRDDSAGFAGRIYDRLVSRLNREDVFFDVDNIELGADFVRVLSDRVADCDALIVVIGKDWLSAADEDNRRRLDDPDDFVRIEVETALQRDIPVIPVLVGGAVMPGKESLPETLKPLARRNGLEISHANFDLDSERLTKALAFVEEARRKREQAAAELLEADRPPAEAEAAKRAEEEKRRTPAQLVDSPKPRSRLAGWRLAAGVAGVAVVSAAAFLIAENGPRQKPTPLETPRQLRLPDPMFLTSLRRQRRRSRICRRVRRSACNRTQGRRATPRRGSIRPPAGLRPGLEQVRRNTTLQTLRV